MASGEVGKCPYVSWKLWQAKPICLWLLEHLVRLAASRTFCTAGSKSAMSTPIIAITTRSSISVKPIRRVNHDFFIIDSLQDKNMKKRKLKLQNSIGKREKTRREDCFGLGAFSFSFHHASRLS